MDEIASESSYHIKWNYQFFLEYTTFFLEKSV